MVMVVKCFYAQGQTKLALIFGLLFLHYQLKHLDLLNTSLETLSYFLKLGSLSLVQVHRMTSNYNILFDTSPSRMIISTMLYMAIELIFGTDDLLLRIHLTRTRNECSASQMTSG